MLFDVYWWLRRVVLVIMSWNLLYRMWQRVYGKLSGGLSIWMPDNVC